MSLLPSFLVYILLHNLISKYFSVIYTGCSSTPQFELFTGMRKHNLPRKCHFVQVKHENVCRHKQGSMSRTHCYSTRVRELLLGSACSLHRLQFTRLDSASVPCCLSQVHSLIKINPCDYPPLNTDFMNKLQERVAAWRHSHSMTEHSRPPHSNAMQKHGVCVSLDRFVNVCPLLSLTSTPRNQL